MTRRGVFFGFLAVLSVLIFLAAIGNPERQDDREMIRACHAQGLKCAELRDKYLVEWGREP